MYLPDFRTFNTASLTSSSIEAYALSNASNGTYSDYFTYKIDEASSWSTSKTADDTYTIGSVDYVINTTYTANTSIVIDLSLIHI